jgi:hypothetical protein
MRKALGWVAAGAILVTIFAGGIARAETNAVTAKGQWLAGQLDQMGVETKWIAGAHIDWDTGLPDGRPEISSGRHTHCSAFVAAAAKRLGVYILRPPEHGQVLLANAQNEWLAEEGRSGGWRSVDGPEQAQNLANHGALVIASYHNHRDDKPGHIAIVRPSAKSDEQIAAEGPDVIQAGTVNSASISIRVGFAGHAHAWNDNEIDYFAHDLAASSAKR